MTDKTDKPTDADAERSQRMVDEIMDEAQDRMEAANVKASDVIMKMMMIAVDQAKGTDNVEAFTKAAVAAIGYANQDRFLEDDETVSDDENQKRWIDKGIKRSRGITDGFMHSARINAAVNDLPVGVVITTMVRAAFQLAVEEKEVDDFRTLIEGLAAHLPARKPTKH